LHPHHDITVYEKNDYIGGHSRTVEAKVNDDLIPVDTGFIVFNKRNYPLLTRLFEYLQVPVDESNMSFGASIDDGWLEYGTQTPTSLFAQRRNLFRPAFWGMLADILKFNAQAKSYLSKVPSFTLGECLDALKIRPWFRQYFLLPMGAAIWSTPLAEMLRFPARSFIQFFDNHGLLTISDHPQWYTVRGGSREYVRRLTEPFKTRIHLSRGVASIARHETGVTVEDVHGERSVYDDVVFACHADQALAMIAEPSHAERRVLSAFRYQTNRAVLHGDTSFMPKRSQAWASWVYLSNSEANGDASVSLSYWMNNLQFLATDRPVLVTLNPGREPDPRLIYDDYTFEHPVFDAAAIEAQAGVERIQGADRLWFCGAYQRYGFHEDGLRSALDMVRLMGVDRPW
jgi:predicted NAD/FAD-binding protein